MATAKASGAVAFSAEYSDDKLSTSTLIVADVMEPVPTKDVSTGSFVIA